ncbi:MAG: hypothetical protein OXG61_13870, partial [Chloroflexi bacterium]|nr:hypothetical protein [Chloroflexota bacterium]
ALWQQVYAELDRLQACREPADAREPESESESETTSAQQEQQTPIVVPEISVSAGAGVVEGGSASFTITANPAPSSPLTVTLSVSQTGDYGAATGTQTVTIPTSGRQSVAVATVGDNVDEADGSVTVMLSAGSGYTVSSSQGSATVSVSDDDDPPPSSSTPTVSVEDASSDEGWSILSFQVTLSGPSDEDVRVSWQTRATRNSELRPAHVGFDYLANSGTIVIGAGKTVGYADVFVESDELNEGDEHFEVQLTSAQGAAIADGTATMTIIDDD